jgi:hypothetical protein
MWLPVYLCQEFGWPGWVAFIVPNCIGAAAVGVVLRSRADSERMEAKHPAVMRWFSIVTVAFHVVFLVAVFPPALEAIGMRSAGIGSWYALAFIAVLLAAFAINLETRRWLQVAAGVYIASMACLILTVQFGEPGTLAIPTDSGPGKLQGLAAAFPVIALGFLLCPMLDLTFHRVRRETEGRAGSYAFILAFVLAFPPLVGFTLLYAGGYQNRLFHGFVVLHILLQSSFTIGVHLRELVARYHWLEGGPRTVWYRRPLVARVLPEIALAVFVLAVLFTYKTDPLFRFHRQLYELFMSMYGLVFPAYVWIVMIERGLPMRPRVIAWLVACAIAAPMYWVGYIQQHYVWLLPGVGVVLVAPLALRVLRGRTVVASAP